MAPPSFFHPKPGDITIEGRQLTNTPSLSDDEKVKFAAFTDPRFYLPHLYRKLIPFLPERFEVIDGPNRQNCYMYCLNIDPKRTKRFERREFDMELEKRGYNYYEFSRKNLRVGDIIVYSVFNHIDSIRTHAGIYIGNGRVRSRWGYNSPLIEHPLEEVIPPYWNREERFLTIERRDI
jgi:hypothetical protein